MIICRAISLAFISAHLAHAALDCGVCLALNDWLPISRSCEQCNGWRPTGQVPASSGVDLRVTKALGVKGYNQVRLSIIQRNDAAPLGHDLQSVFRNQRGAVISPFKLRWEHSTYFTRIMSASDADELPSTVRPAPLPTQGGSVTGLLFGDPCSYDSWVGCGHAREFHTRNTTPALVNLFMDNQDLHFYALLGDNFYDQTGEITALFWNALTSKAKSKILMTVPGNHDFWVQGSPISRLLWRSRSDQYGYGLAQWHMMDTVAAKGSLNYTDFGANNVFDYSVDPDAAIWPVHAVKDSIAHPSNFFWYNQLGDVVFVGFSGAHDWKTQSDYFHEACDFLSAVQQTANWVVLLGHWDFTEYDLGWCGSKMDTPVGYWRMATSSCPAFKDFYSRGRLKFVSGHTHCNIPNPHSHPHATGAAAFSLVDNTTGYDGFLMGGTGMHDGSPTCVNKSNYGVTIMSTSPGEPGGDRLEIIYFKVGDKTAAGSTYQYQTIETCVTRFGWRHCAATHPELAEVWLNVTAASWRRAVPASDVAHSSYV